MREPDVSAPATAQLSACDELRVEPARLDDLPDVRAAYAHARAIQRWEGAIVWPEFTDESIIADVERGSLYRVMDRDQLVGVFSVAYEDAAIWGTLERGEHLYLHRIARAETYPGRGLVAAVLAWAREQRHALGRTGLRLDTWASNTTLVGYYERQGFRVVTRRQMGFDPRLPPHYHGNEYALLEEVPDAQADEDGASKEARLPVGDADR
jgi:ribosomal protein S18 acetylase RimI-like enzyme